MQLLRLWVKSIKIQTPIGSFITFTYNGNKEIWIFFSPEEIKMILIMEHLYKDDIDYRTLITYGGNSFEFVV